MRDVPQKWCWDSNSPPPCFVINNPDKMHSGVCRLFRYVFIFAASVLFASSRTAVSRDAYPFPPNPPAAISANCRSVNGGVRICGAANLSREIFAIASRSSSRAIFCSARGEPCFAIISATECSARFCAGGDRSASRCSASVSVRVMSSSANIGNVAAGVLRMSFFRAAKFSAMARGTKCESVFAGLQPFAVQQYAKRAISPLQFIAAGLPFIQHRRKVRRGYPKVLYIVFGARRSARAYRIPELRKNGAQNAPLFIGQFRAVFRRMFAVRQRSPPKSVRKAVSVSCKLFISFSAPCHLCPPLCFAAA